MKAKTKRRLKHLVGKKKILNNAQARTFGRSVFIGILGACTASLTYAMTITHPTVTVNVRSTISGKSIHAPVVVVATSTPSPVVSGGPNQIGRGSWYALGLRSPDALTCASRTFPRGSHLEVTNSQNGRKAICLVNDYGPAAWTGRVVDLSRGMFSSIANLGQGTIPVEIRLIDKATSLHLPATDYVAVIGYRLCSQKASAAYCDAHRKDTGL
jgi:rare lipoprotein A (peptidoglycan hydrolase)